MHHKRLLIALVILLIVTVGALVWTLQPISPSDGGWGGSSADVTVDIKGVYNDNALGSDQIQLHSIRDVKATAYASNWKQTLNLDLLTLQGQRFGAYVDHSLATWQAQDYPVDIRISFLQNGQVASAVDGGALTRDVSFTVHMDPYNSLSSFEKTAAFSGVKAGTYTIVITLLSAQSFSDLSGRSVKSYQFAATFGQ